MMTTFIYGGYQYTTPIFMVKALDRKSIPEAFEQMHKLRHSGYLAGFIRSDAFAPAEKDEGPFDSRGEPTPHINFILYRHRVPVPEAKPKPRSFCPALDRAFAGTDIEKARETILAADPAADVVYCRELGLGTAADGRAVFNELAPVSPYAAYYRDSFEELIFLPRRVLLRVDRPGVGAEETLTVSVSRASETSLAAEAAKAVAREGSVRVVHGAVTCVLREDATVGEMIRAFVPAISAVGATGTLAGARAMEGRVRGVFGGVVGFFGGYGCELALVERTLERRPGDKRFRLGVGVRLAADVELDDEVERGRREVRSLVLPEGAAFTADIRVEEGVAFLLREQLVRVKKAAEARDVDTGALDGIMAEIMDTVRPVPGDSGSPVPDMMMLCWQQVPEELARLAGLDAGAGCVRLTVRLDADGSVSASCAPLAAPVTRELAFARRTLDERNDFLPLPMDFHPWYGEAEENAAAGTCLDTLFVNRVGVVAGCALGGLVFELDGVLVTPPPAAGASGDVLMAALRQRGIVKERSLSLAEIFGATRVWHVSALRGALLADLKDPLNP